MTRENEEILTEAAKDDESYRARAMLLLSSSMGLALMYVFPLLASNTLVSALSGTAVAAAGLTSQMAADEQYYNKDFSLKQSLQSAFHKNKVGITAIALIFGLLAGTISHFAHADTVEQPKTPATQINIAPR
jgi:hypothetical protein